MEFEDFKNKYSPEEVAIFKIKGIVRFLNSSESI